MLNKPKFNLPNYLNPDELPRYQFRVVPRCLMSTLEEKVLFKEGTEPLLNIQNFIQRFRNQMKGIKYFNNTYQGFALRIFIHQLIKRADSVLISFDLGEEEKVIKISALEISEKFLTPKFKHIELTVSVAK